ncbi:MAG: CoA transferase, partial [Gemmatimonadetes bacterium]
MDNDHDRGSVEPTRDAPRPLAGVRVIDLTQNLAGPYCTQILADLGADVVKVEPPGGDRCRAWGPPFIAGQSPLFMAVNRGKRSVVLDLRDPDAAGALRRLVAGADVFCEAFRSGVAERLGFGYEDVRALRPDVIYASVTAYGPDGPLADQPGYDPLMQAYAGLMSVTGEPDGPPLRAGVSLVDFATGVWTALGVLAALRTREQTGEGTHVVASLLDSALAMASYHLAAAAETGRAPERQGTGLAMIAPYEAFPTRDGDVMIGAANDALFARLCEALEAPELAADPRFATNPERVRNRSALAAALADRTRALTRADLLERLRRARVPASPVHDALEVLADPQVRATGMLRPRPLEGARDYRDVALPLRWD